MNRAFKTYRLLAPLGGLYRTGTWIRNLGYDRGLLKSYEFPFPVISIGNITVGGTGKTPHTLYMVSLLGAGPGVTVLSRGYGRATKGFILADADSTARLIGDEPFMLHKSFPNVRVAVSEDRVKGLQLLSAASVPYAAVLDDAFQHRRVKPSLNILLVDWNRNILDDMVLPAGRMRESAAGRSRADIIIVTKCPDSANPAHMDALAARLAVRPEQKVFFSKMEYGEMYSMARLPQKATAGVPVLALTGIAQPAPMVSYLEGCGHHVELLAYPDHHSFVSSDIETIADRIEAMPAGSIIVTTQKDESRLLGLDLPQRLLERIFVLPVAVSFVRDKDSFDRLLIQHVESFNRKQ